jgi:hypothetical protein
MHHFPVVSTQPRAMFTASGLSEYRGGLVAQALAAAIRIIIKVQLQPQQCL